MANAISYSLFGFNQSHDQCLDWRSYCRGFEVNMRVAELLYTNYWKVHVTLDEQTYNSPYKELFDYHKSNGKIDLDVVPNEALCMMMLRRVAPVFSGKYDRVICRDTDSLLSYRERQAVLYWERGGRIAHAITDSVSHTIPLMGGMVGFMCKELKEALGCNTFDQMTAMMPGIDYSKKGADQDFLNGVIFPRVHHSITEHYVLGRPYSFREDCHNKIQDIDLGLPEYLKETNHLAYHIGAAGYQEMGVIKLLQQHSPNNEYYNQIERKFPEIFYWQL